MDDFLTEKDIQKIKKMYQPGTRVKLLHMDDPQAPPIGTYGLVSSVDDIGTVFVHWDNGSGLGCVLTEDRIEIID